MSFGWNKIMLNKIIQGLSINTVICGDTLSVLRGLPSESVDSIITSPPYYGLRDYGTAKWEGGDEGCDHQVGRNTRGGLSDFQQNNKGSFGDEAIKNGELCPKCGAKRIDQQLGLEKTLDEYLNKMLLITKQLHRVLKKTGTMWWNHGDSYNGNKVGKTDKKCADYVKDSMPNLKKEMQFMPEKSLMLQNYRLIIRMIDEQQWILRNTIIWHKPNCMPSSVKDRFTVDFEPVFFFVKSKKYWFETQYEKFSEVYLNENRPMGVLRQRMYPNSKYNKFNYAPADHRGENDNTEKNYGLKHPAGHRDWQNGMNERGKDAVIKLHPEIGRNKRCVWRITTQPFKEAHFATFPEKLIEPMVKAGCPKGGIVLDPFFGAGTTGVVAKKWGKNYLGIELSKEYIKIAKKRISQTPKPLFS